jgi:hypothetical protein
VSRDLCAAQDFYASWLGDGSRIITARIEARLRVIARNPELFREVHRDIRQALVPRSYFGILYRIRPAATEVLAILDLRRDPAEISRQITKRKRLP